MLVVYLDAYHLGDPLFVPGLARDVAARGTGLLLVHGSGERGERALESLGRMPRATAGVWEAGDPEGQDAVERATRELSREILHELNEAGVSAIRATASDRGVIEASADGLRAGRVEWLRDLVRAGVTVVVAALGTREGQVVELDAAQLAGVLATALDGSAVALTRRSLDPKPAVLAQEGVFADREAILRLLETGAHVQAGPRALIRDASGAGLQTLST